MLTVFGLPKASAGHVDLIQRNAVASWTRLHPGVEVILFGDDRGVAEIARDLGVRHVPRVLRNDLGTPLISDVFSQAQALARHGILCYANADIIFLPDLPQAIDRAHRWRARFLLVGRRWNVDLGARVECGTGWDEDLRRRVLAEGELQDEWWIDYFVFPKGLIAEMPAFAVGRAAWDNWLIYYCRSLRIPVVDATASVMAVHQNHDYAHVPQARGLWQGPESERNRELAGGPHQLFTLADATHRLDRNRVVRNLSLQPVRRLLQRRFGTLGIRASLHAAVKRLGARK